MQSTESDITLDSNNIVTSKVFVCTVRYYYDAEDGLVKKRIQFANGSEHTVNYEKAAGDKGTVLLSPFFIDIIHQLCYSKLG